MAYAKLVFTILGRDDNKYEVYAQGEHAEPERVIHYKLVEIVGADGSNTTPIYEWKVINPNMTFPESVEYRIASILIWYLSRL